MAYQIILCRFMRIEFGNQYTVTQYRNCPGKLKDLIKPVRDVKDGITGGAKFADESKQSFCFAVGQSGGRFVKYQDAG